MAGRREKFTLIRMAQEQRAEGRAMDRVGSMGGALGCRTWPVIAGAESLATRLPTVPDAPDPPAERPSLRRVCLASPSEYQNNGAFR